MKNYTLKAQLRPLSNRGDIRRLRRLENRVPAVLYGGDEQPISLSLAGDEVNRFALEEAFYTHILSLEIDENKHQAVVKDVQRHPFRREVLHLDFLRVQQDRELTMHVPIHLLNERTAAGVRAGGIVNHLLNELEVRCLPKDIPEYIEIDIAQMDVEQTLHLSEVKLPEGVILQTELSASHDPGVVAIHKPRAEVVDKPVETTEEPSAEDPDAAPTTGQS